jgi:tRNA dimethylallyltransferase
MKNMKKKIVVISGPTASGKSKLAIELAKKYDGVVINADSMQVYQGLPILSAQPSKANMAEVEHKLYGVLKPDEKCSAGIWLEMVCHEIDEARKFGKMPIVVGGTGMYISVLINGLSPIPTISDETRRKVVEIYANNGDSGGKSGNAKLFDLVKSVDPDTAKRVGVTDRQRLIRAYEVYLETGKNLSEWQKVPNKVVYGADEFFHINISPPREELYERCDKRFKLMVDEGGVLDEVREFLKQWSKALKGGYSVANTLGLVEIVDYLNGKVTKEEMLEIVIQKTRNYAKRQLTWFRHQFKEYDLVVEECVSDGVVSGIVSKLFV